MMFRPRKLKLFLIIPVFFLILSTFFSLSHCQLNYQNIDLQSDEADASQGREALSPLNGIKRLVMRKLEGDEDEKDKDEDEGDKDDKAPRTNYSIILIAKQTERRDPLDNFKYYKGGWDINNRHYHWSVAFTSAPFVIAAVVWFVLFGFFLLIACICCCCCHRNKPYGYSQIAYAISLSFLILCTIVALFGCVIMYTGEGRFLHSVHGLTRYVVDQGFSMYDEVVDIQNLLVQAKDVVLNKEYVSDELKGQVDEVNKAIASVGTLPQLKSEDVSNKIKTVLKHVNSVLIAATSLMLLLAFVGFLFSILGMKTCVYIFVVIGWFIITITFVLCGIFLVFHNIVADTCNAMDEWVQNPMADSAMKEILPCFDTKVGEEIKSTGESVTKNVNELLNSMIQLVNNDKTPYNLTGSLVPLVCDPYESEQNCSDRVPLKKAKEEWTKYKCESTNGVVCTTQGRLTQRTYDEMVKAVNISDGLYESSDFIAGIANCSTIQDTFRNITTDHCPGLKKYSKWVYNGLVTATISVMFSLFFWLMYVRERRHRKYTLRVNKGYDESPLVGGKKL